jgi:hypothetical protein
MTTTATDEMTAPKAAFRQLLVEQDGRIEGRLIGGMTFYVAPPSAFGHPRHGNHGDGHGRGDDRECHDLIDGGGSHINLPWTECDFAGELELKIHFRKRP